MEKEKMKMKNVFMLLLGAMLVLGMAGVVSAEIAPVSSTKITETDIPDTGSKTHTTTITLSLDQSFEVTLPADFHLTDDDDDKQYTGLAYVNATVHLLNPGYVLLVNMTSDDQLSHSTDSRGNNFWNLTNTEDSSKVLRYIVHKGINEQDHADKDVITGWFASGETLIERNAIGTSTAYIHFLLYDDVSKHGVGTFTDQLTFTVSVINRS